MLLVCVPQHVFQVFLELDSQKETSGNFLNLDDLLPSFVEVNLDVVPGAIATVEALNEDTRAISLKDTPESVNVYLKIEQMLFCRLFLGVIRDVELHELVEASESVSERSIFNSLFVGYNKIVKSQKRLNAVN
tara:strand:- start:412 stop:810 length:399 start_codon:yes stop_codon:yes gene_type:complete